MADCLRNGIRITGEFGEIGISTFYEKLRLILG
jgi:hypothetical protein